MPGDVEPSGSKDEARSVLPDDAKRRAFAQPNGEVSGRVDEDTPLAPDLNTAVCVDQKRGARRVADERSRSARFVGFGNLHAEAKPLPHVVGRVGWGVGSSGVCRERCFDLWTEASGAVRAGGGPVLAPDGRFGDLPLRRDAGEVDAVGCEPVLEDDPHGRVERGDV